MYVNKSLNALNEYPHTLRFEPIRNADMVRRHNWSPGYYEDTDEELDHHLDAPEDDILNAAPDTSEPAIDENKKNEQATDGELDRADA